MEYKIDSIILVRAGLVRVEVTTLKFGEIVIPIEFEVTDGLEKEDEFEKTLKKKLKWEIKCRRTLKEEKSEMLLKIETKGNFVADGRRIEFDIMKISRDRSKPNNWNITVFLSDFLGEVEIPLDIDSAGLYNSINNFVRDKVKLVFENQVKPNASLLEKIKTEVGRIHEIQVD